MLSKFKAYYQLVKPGVLYGNVLTAVAGFFLASADEVDWWQFAAMLAGMTMVVGGACALNNYLDCDIDAKMERTKHRPSVTGSVSPKGNLRFALILAIGGLIILVKWTNILTAVIGILGFVTYVWLYGAWTKRMSVHGTAVGAVSGALPIAGGYAAASGRIDWGIVIVFLILFFWQFPEFYSIAIYRKKEYAAARIPVMPVVKGIRSTTIQIFLYTILYVLSTLALTPLGYTGWIYFVIMLVFGMYWIWLGYQGLVAKSAEKWARQMFRFSMITILVLCVMLSIGPLLP